MADEKADDFRFAKADADRFSGAPRINKIKPENMAYAGEHAAWAEDFANRFAASLPTLENGMRSWMVGVKIVAKDGSNQGTLYLRLKVHNGGRGDDDKRRWLYVPLGSDAKPEDLAAVTVAKMAKQPSKHAVIKGRKHGHAVEDV